MAIDTGMYAMQQFQVAMKVEDTVGTPVVASMQYVNIDGYPSVSRNPERYLEIRHGAGTTAKKVDAYVNQYGKEKTISFTAFYDQTWAPIFINNCIGKAVGASPASYDVAFDYTGEEIKHADTSKAGLGTYTCALISPEGTNSEIYPGCVVDSFKMSADNASDGGRFKMDVTLKTRYNISGSQAAPTTPSAYPSTYRTLHDLATKISIGGVDCIMNKMELTLNSQVKFHGFGANGIPNTIARGIPEFLVTGLFGIKYDANTAPMIPKQYDENDIAVEISNHATWASATFGIKGSFGQISDNFDPSELEGSAFIDLPIKFLASTSGDVIQVVP